MGMPFPIGILSIKHLPNGAVAWAWALNGVFTVIGGFSAVVISLFAGFTIALLVGCSAYVVAFFSFIFLARYANSNAVILTEDISIANIN